MPADKIVRTVYVGDAASLLRSHAQIEASSARTAKAVQASGAGMDAAMARSSKATADMARAFQIGGLGLGAALVGAAAQGARFEKQFSLIDANLRPTSEGLKQLRTDALEMSKGTAFSATDAAKAITELGKAGVSTAAIHSGALKGALDLAAAGELSVSEAAETAASAMTQFGLEGSKVPHIADLLAAGAGKAQGSVHDLGMALNQSGLVAHSMGLSVEETTTALAAMASAGLTGSDAGTSFKSMLQRLTPQSAEAAKEMANLGISAFDAQGKFIGLEGFAANLQQGLSGLTDEQRNAALATMFGSDAVRAANVIYSQGADGIRQWAGEVNEAGYAAETARRAQDNLIGDLNKLKQALSNSAIEGGSGLNDTLRLLAQSATAVVDVIGDVPSPVLQTAAALAVMAAVGPKFAAMGGQVTGGLSKVRTSIAETVGEQVRYQRTLESMGSGFVGMGDKSMSGAARFRSATGIAKSAAIGMKGAAAGLMGVMGGPWGLALGAATMALGYYAQKQAEGKARVQELTDIIAAQGGVLGENSRQWAAKSLQDRGVLDAAQQLGINLQDVTAAALGNETAMGRVNDQLAKYKDQYVESFGMDGAELTAEGEAAQKLSDALGDTNSEVSQAVKNQRQLADATGETSGGMDVAAKSTKTLASEQKQLADDLKAAEDAAKAALDAIIQLGSGGRDLGAAQRSTRASIREMTASLKEYREAVKSGDKDKLAEATDKLGASMSSAAQDALTEASALVQVKGDVAGATRAYDDARGKIVAAAQAMGKTKPEAEAMATSIMGTKKQFVDAANEAKRLATEASNAAKQKVTIPTSAPGAVAAKGQVVDLHAALKGVPGLTKAQVSTPGAKVSKGEADALKSALEAIPAERRSKVLSAFDKGGVTAAYNALNAINGKVAVTYIRTVRTETQNIVRKITTTGTGGSQYATLPSARGNLYEFAAGGFGSGGYTDRVPQFGGSNRDIIWPLPGGKAARWNEPHLPWEAYISGDPKVKDRSLAIWQQTGKRLGVEGFAGGGIPGVPITARSSSYGDLLVAMDRLSRATLISAGATSASVAEARAAKTRLASQHRIEDADMAARIAAANGSKAKAGLRTEKAQQDARQAREMAAATERVAAAQRGNAAATDKAKKSMEDYKAKQQAVSDALKKVADDARAMSDKLSGRYDLGWDAADTGAIMREGAADLTRLAGQVSSLRGLGLRESVLQQIIDKGPGQGTELAADILAGGKGRVDSLNASAKALQTAADRLGRLAVADAPAVNAHRASVARAVRSPYGAAHVAAQAGPAQVTYAPHFEAHGTDAREAMHDAMSQAKHEFRRQAVMIPGS